MRIFNFHMAKLAIRGVMFLALCASWFLDTGALRADIYAGFSRGLTLPNVFWLVLVIESLLRFFPSKLESRGCQKQFKSFYLPSPIAGDALPAAEKKRSAMNRAAVIVAVSWAALNSVVAALYFTGAIDEAVLLLVSAAYTVCDMVCILFYCPFQVLMMKNRCCVTCRVYNWDFIMICTPLFFFRSFLSWSLCLIALLLLARWEYVFLRYPERFSLLTNSNLKCSGCKDRMCRYKKSGRIKLFP